MDDLREAGLVKGGDWYSYFWQVVNPAFGVFPDAWVKLQKVYEDMYGRYNFFETFLPRVGTFLGIGVGFGGLELVLANRGWRGLGIDNNRDALFLAAQNSALLAQNRLMVCYADIYDPAQVPGFFSGKGITACVSFGVMEHFKPHEIRHMIERQLEIAPRVICMVPVGTPPTLKFFGANKTGPHIEKKSGIYRVLQPPQWWDDNVFDGCNVLTAIDSKNPLTGHDMTTWVVEKRSS